MHHQPYFLPKGTKSSANWEEKQKRFAGKLSSSKEEHKRRAIIPQDVTHLRGFKAQPSGNLSSN